MPSVAAIVLTLAACGGRSDIDAIEKHANERWQRASLAKCEDGRAGPDYPADASFYVCEVRNLNPQERDTLFLNAPAESVVSICFVVLADGDVLVPGQAHDQGACSKTR